MEASPLVQQARPSFQPKISQLYEDLFVDEESIVLTEGYWNEFFVLKPDKASLQRRLDTLDADGLLHFQHETQSLFTNAVNFIKVGRAPSDEVALDTLIVFLAGILSKRYTNPSADIITVLAGLDEVDAVFSDFANALENIIRAGRTFDARAKAIQVALSLTSGAYQTSLVSYFTHRDLFPSLMKFVHESETSSHTFDAFLLLGLLVNYNKFEYKNPYRLRLEDFVNESTITKILAGFGSTCTSSRNKYIAVLEDVPEGWTLNSTLAYIGLGVLAPIKAITPIGAADDSKDQFAVLPGPEAAVLLATYDFANANKLFSYNLISCPSESKRPETPFSAFLSYTSYILHHAYRSPRATLYGLLNLSTLRIIVEDPVLCKRICSDETSITVRLCRQRQPFLPVVNSSRPITAQILDITIDAINHNLRRRLDLDLYIACINLIQRLLCCLSQNHLYLTYHWSLLWQSLLSLLCFLVTYHSDLTTQSLDIHTLITPLLRTIGLAIVFGSAFLHDPVAYDDLFYKLVEHADALSKLKGSYRLLDDSPISILIHVATHYHDILEAEGGKGRMNKNLTPKEVGKIIRQGYDTMDLPVTDEMRLEAFERYREADERGMVKKVGRCAVEDTRKLVKYM